MEEFERGGYIFRSNENGGSIVIDAENERVIGTLDIPADEVYEMDEREFIKKLEENYII